MPIKHCVQKLTAVGAALFALVSTAAAIDSATTAAVPPPPSPPLQELVRIVLIGATGNLAAKYLWVASFRLALQAHIERGQQVAFIAAASHTHDAGNKWRDAFFTDAFHQRVCGSTNNGNTNNVAPDTMHAYEQCTAFFYDRFVPSITYAPLRTETQYRQLGAALAHNPATGNNKRQVIEIGRLVYLAIPPAHFASSSELAHKHLRPRTLARSSVGNDSTIVPFFRIAIEKPFGVDLQSAQSLQRSLKQRYDRKEIYVVDHFAGKSAVRALREYLTLNAATLTRLWTSDNIEQIAIDMTEDETCATRIPYFHATGIIRDVLANHVHLLLSLVVTLPLQSLPSSEGDATLTNITNNNSTSDRSSRAFVQSLARDARQPLVLGQYDSYAQHYAHEVGANNDSTSVFVPTAARVQLRSHQQRWRNTTFVVAAAKAVHERRLQVRVVFRHVEDEKEKDAPCTLTVTLQTHKHAAASERIAWTCSGALDDLAPPRNWHRLLDDDVPAFEPIHAATRPRMAWALGNDAPSAYDVLLQAAVRGDQTLFTSIEDAVAAWRLWSPIVALAEQQTAIRTGEMDDERVRAAPLAASAVVYSVGSTAWDQQQQVSEAEHDEL